MILRFLTLSLLILVFSCTSQPELNTDFDDGGFGKAIKPYEAPVGKINKEDFSKSFSGEHVVKPEDILEVMVIGHPDTQVARLPVSPDGHIYYLMAKPVYAEGLTLGQLKLKLESALVEFFASPKVFVQVIERNQNTFQIMGKVNLPGEYSLEIPLNLREAIALAGGLKSGIYRTERVNLASLKYSYIIRNGKKLPVDFSKLLDKGESNQNIYVRPGDYIYLASAISKEVYVLGDVLDPRSVYFKDDLTALKVLTNAKINKESYLNECLIIRKSLKDPQIIRVNFAKILEGKERDVYMQPGDILYIPEDPNKPVKDVVKMVFRAFVQAFASDGGLYFSDEVGISNDR